MLDIKQVSKRNLSLSIDDDDAEIVFKALANAQRLRILQKLGTNAFTVAQITDYLGIPTSTANQHIKVLEDAGLIQSDLRPASRGTEKVCRAVYTKLLCDLLPNHKSAERAIEISMPVGAYSDFKVERPCGLASRQNVIGIMGDEEAFFEPERVNAHVLWFADGYVEYRFPKRLPPRTILESLSLSMEICSEAPGYNEDWPSEITLWINDIEIGSWISPGDFGEIRGVLNPDWWGSSNTQYGILKNWQVNALASYIDGIQISDVTVSDLNAESSSFISVRLGIKEDSDIKGGITLFGRFFGNYPQDIVLRLIYRQEM